MTHRTSTMLHTAHIDHVQDPKYGKITITTARKKRASTPLDISLLSGKPPNKGISSTVRRHILFENVKKFAKNYSRAKAVDFNVPLGLEGQSDMHGDILTLAGEVLAAKVKSDEFRLKSQVWLESVNPADDGATLNLSKSDFWDLLFKQEWRGYKTLRLCDGPLLSDLLSHVTSMVRDGELAEHISLREDYMNTTDALEAKYAKPHPEHNPVLIKFIVYYINDENEALAKLRRQSLRPVTKEKPKPISPAPNTSSIRTFKTHKSAPILSLDTTLGDTPANRFPTESPCIQNRGSSSTVQLRPLRRASTRNLSTRKDLSTINLPDIGKLSLNPRRLSSLTERRCALRPEAPPHDMSHSCDGFLPAQLNMPTVTTYFTRGRSSLTLGKTRSGLVHEVEVAVSQINYFSKHKETYRVGDQLAERARAMSLGGRGRGAITLDSDSEPEEESAIPTRPPHKVTRSEVRSSKAYWKTKLARRKEARNVIGLPSGKNEYGLYSEPSSSEASTVELLRQLSRKGITPGQEGKLREEIERRDKKREEKWQKEKEKEEFVDFLKSRRSTLVVDEWIRTRNDPAPKKKIRRGPVAHLQARKDEKVYKMQTDDIASSGLSTSYLAYNLHHSDSSLSVMVSSSEGLSRQASDIRRQVLKWRVDPRHLINLHHEANKEINIDREVRNMRRRRKEAWKSRKSRRALNFGEERLFMSHHVRAFDKRTFPGILRNANTTSPRRLNKLPTNTISRLKLNLPRGRKARRKRDYSINRQLKFKNKKKLMQLMTRWSEEDKPLLIAKDVLDSNGYAAQLSEPKNFPQAIGQILRENVVDCHILPSLLPQVQDKNKLIQAIKTFVVRKEVINGEFNDTTSHVTLTFTMINEARRDC